MRSSGWSVTMARLVSARLPKVNERRLRLRLPLRFSVFTFNTRTLNARSTASWICGFVACGWTRNVYTFRSSRAYDFSDTIGSMMTSRASGISRVLFLLHLDRCLRGGCRAGQGLAREHHVVRDEDVVRVQLAGELAVHFLEVAEALPDGLVVLTQYEEDLAGQTELGEGRDRVLGLRRVDRPLVDHDHLVVRCAIRERAEEREAHHLLRRLLRVATRRERVRHSAAAPLR